ncbi:MAG: hypothetical protein CMA10_04510 [Euryarchaeota archaeon]|nr:hypothetical protein [Euryarchaeota archaeon]|tara:strand:+ start:2445 stop:2957 length:513 start_codon:yes stop_codon:yes gene_type:complete
MNLPNEEEEIEGLELIEDNPDMMVPGQSYVVFSFLGPKIINGKESSIIKFRGAFATEDAALERARDLSKIDENFDITVARAGVWLPVPPPPGVDVEYHNEVLNQMLSKEKGDRTKEKLEFDKRVKKARMDHDKAEIEIQKGIEELKATVEAQGKGGVDTKGKAPAVDDSI